jgi:6-phosphogluconolactonase
MKLPLLLVLFVCLTLSAMAQTTPTDYVLIGTYTNTEARSAGIYVYAFDPKTGALTLRSQMGGIQNPSFLALSPDRRFVYAVGETDGDGMVAAYGFNRETGQLTALNRQSAGGSGSCHLTVDKTGRWLLVGNYGGGNLSVLPIRADGSLGAAQQTINHSGTGPNAERQQGPHVHQVVIAPNNRDVLVPDLGTDRVMLYQLNEQTGRLSPAAPASVSGTAGGGPRHLTLHPHGSTMYLLEELTGSVVTFSQQNGRFERLQTVSALPPDYSGPAAAAEIVAAPDGRFLYASVRGNNTLALFTINPTTGQLTYRSSTDAGGKGPRSFALDPSGRWLLAAHQYSNTVRVFARDVRQGTLTPTGEPIPVPTPVCMLPVPMR